MNQSVLWIMAAWVAFLFAGCSEPSSNKVVEDGTSEIPDKLADVEILSDTKGDPGEAISFFVVDHYDPARDAVEDLEMATELASKSGKRILIEVGGKWWGWCPRLDEFVQTNEKIADLMRNHFLIMKVNYSEENKNADFLGKYPEVPAYPHYFVLETDGTFLHSQGTGDLEKGSSYDEDVFAAFLGQWKPGDSGAKWAGMTELVGWRIAEGNFCWPAGMSSW
jgi:hypothetical protein